MIAGLVLMLIGLVTIFVPWLGLVELEPISKAFVSVAGVILGLTGGFVLFLRLYRKTSANLAFVRTGSGGAKPVLDGGSIVIPLIHNVIPIALETMKLDVERIGEDALITRDNLRVDVRGEFYIKVDANREDIIAAARSLGEKGTHPAEVAKLVFEKLVSALRSVAATMDLVEIHGRREDFAKAVFESVREDLKHNGLTLESVTISRLDQTDPKTLSDDNIFDAQGKKKITEITQAALVERNRLTRDAERATTQKDVETRQEILTLERTKAEAEAAQAADVANVRKAKEREQREFAIEQERLVREAEIAQNQQVEQRRIAQELAVQASDIARQQELIAKEQEREQADITRKKAVETARITQEQAVEVAAREQQINVAKKETERAAAERDKLQAEAARETAQQEVLTVQVTQEANREAEKRLIAAKQVIEQDKIKRQTDAEVEAFAEVKAAEAQQMAATAEAAARLQRAEAEAKATRMQAEADQARKVVDVNIERERVEVEQKRVEVERQSLENKQTFERAAIEFETQKLRIEAEKEVKIALANSLGTFMSRGQFQVYGDPTTMSKMMTQFSHGLGFGNLVEGLLSSGPEVFRELGADALDKLRGLLNGGNGAPPAPEPEPEPAGEVDEFDVTFDEEPPAEPSQSKPR